MLRRSLCFPLFALAITAHAAAATLEFTPEEREFLRAHPVWRLAGGTAQPFQWMNEKGEYLGMGADYRAILETRLGVRFEPVPAGSWSESLRQLRRRQCDISLLTSATPEREIFLSFTEPLLELPPTIITRAEDKSIKSLADLAGKRVAVPRDRPVHERLARDHPEIILLPRDDVPSALSALAMSDAEAYVGELASATQAIQLLGIRNLRIAGEFPYSFPFRIGVRKDWPIAVQLLDRAIATITPEEHSAIRRKWISMRDEGGPSLRQVLVYALPISIGGVILTLLLVNRRLHGEVEQRKTTESALRESEERWGFALEGSNDGVWDWKVKTNGVFFSRRWKAMLGFVEDELENRLDEWTARIHDEDIDATLDAVQRHLRGETASYEIEHRVLAKDGQYRWMLARGRVVARDNEGMPTRMVGTQTDITARKHAEQALQTAKEFAEELIETANAMVLGMDEQGKITIFNRAAEEITGYTRKELEDRNWWEVLVPQDRFPEVWEAIGPGSESGLPPRYENPILTKSGEERFIVWQNGVLREGGRNAGTVSFGIDITERRRAEDELRRHEEQLEETVRIRTADLQAAERRLRDMTNQIPGAVYQFVRDHDGAFSFIFCSEGMEAMVGVRAEDAVRDVNTVWSVIHPDDLAELIPKANMSAETMTRYVQDLRICQPDGRRWWIRAESDPQRRPDGTILWNGNIMDITERKRLEEELAVAKSAAEAANRAKSVFLANMSHEIRTPMNAILGFSQLMFRDPALTPQQRLHLDTINRSGEHLLALINDILEMSKIEAGRVRLQTADFNLHALLDDLERMFRLRTEARLLRFTVERTGDLPQYVRGDEGKVRQIFINLIGNAVKFTERGFVVVRVEAHDREHRAFRLHGEVEDTGPGIAAAELPRLFHEFEQTASGQRAGGGTGLGLAISRQFARLMGGDMDVASEVGRGTTFHFDLPLELGEAAAIRAAADQRRVVRLQPAFAGTRVLIADDTAENRMHLEQLLRPIGFETRAVADGLQAVTTFAEWKPHLVLMDLRMPVLDGPQAIARIRALPEGATTPIIVVTASAFEENRREVMDAGADDFLGKPFREADLFERIGRLAGVAFQYAAEAPPEPGPQPEVAITAESIARAIPGDLRDRLRAAAVRADFDAMLAVVAEAEPAAPEIAAELRRWVERFEYPRLLGILEAETLVS